MKEKITLKLIVFFLFIASYANAQYSGGTGLQSDPYRIRTVQDLMNISGNGYYFRLETDLDLTTFLSNSTTGWEPLKSFNGYFDGKGHTIKGLWSNSNSKDNIGLFSENKGEIKNLHIVLAAKGIIGKNKIGGLVGSNSGTITQCSVTGNSSCEIFAESGEVGGLTGYNSISGTIMECYTATFSIWGGSSGGGLVGYNEGLINRTYSSCSIRGGNNIGGLVGHAVKGNISQSYAYGSVNSGGLNTGGLIGKIVSTEATTFGCYFDKDKAGISNDASSLLIARSTSDMLKKTTYENWDFTYVWKIDENESYPYFTWQKKSATSVNSIKADDYSVYPNPTRGNLTINCPPNTKVQIYNICGVAIREFVSKNQPEYFNLASYPTGFYIIKMGSKTIRVMKQ